MKSTTFDIIVVGGGHAGCEAAMAAAKLGSSVLLLSMDSVAFAKMSCNPAIGGIAKGQIVREIDAMGGYTGIVTDESTLQFRMLNRSKGPAMWSPRAQCDKIQFSLNWRKHILSNSNITLYEDSAVSLLFENSKLAGVRTKGGAIFKSRTVIVTAGTFLNGKIFIGREQMTGGRIGESSSLCLSDQIKSLGVRTQRMKTGTPPRIDITTVNTEKLTLQNGDGNPARFSYLPVLSSVQSSGVQLPCYILHTNQKVHTILRQGFNDSPLFTGLISGKGPRYCPSIEDKLRVFPDKDAHQLFLEPEGNSLNEYYLQGFSSSLPFKVQMDALHSIEGMENAKVFRPAYAVEYDYFDPTQLKPTLESQVIENLFFAGQVNGTTGYEEAAAQGLMAGINAHLKIAGKDGLVLSRDSSYIGVLIDDLVTKGVDEPYRMFTSRAEYRILLRQDNADLRLTGISHDIGLADDDRYSIMCDKYRKVSTLSSFCSNVNLSASLVDDYLVSVGSSKLSESKKISDIASRPQVELTKLLSFVPRGTINRYSIQNLLETEIVEAVEIAIKYKGYIDREQSIASKISKLENLCIPDDFDFSKVSGLTIECRQKLAKYKPRTIAQASRISGVSPSDISVLLIHFGR
ncbi:MAG: tRNA uridine-5-carboxymethylaminomethyl(34) synthesis enzyme MnmG [Bacteroidales bacterium]|nr:tRNA uridine-5-carboxymethylaminomethyl(34) synthesis enzyme MnmG [Bacteroidales bacterium]